MTTLWKKIWTDLWSNKARTLLAALSIAVGVFAVGLIVTSFTIVKKDMEADYFAVNPHTVRIYTQNFDAEILHGLANTPGVTAIEARYNVWVKIDGRNGKQYPINLNSIGALDEMQVDKLVFEQGERTLGYKEIYLERQGAEGLGLKPGDIVDLVLNDGRTRTLIVAGTVHDVTANPFKFSASTAGYVTPKTMEWLGESSQFNFVTIATSGSQTDAAHIRTIAEDVAVRIERSGYQVANININNPGKHPAQSTIDTVLMLMSVLGFMAVLLSGFLIINTMTALMGQHIRQIGVLKAIGATVFQLIDMYMVLVLAFGLLALLIAMPLSALASYGFTRWLIGMLNATPSPFSISPTALWMQAIIALGVPVFTALVPVLNGARLTVRQAITNYGLSAPSQHGLFDRLLESLQGLPRPILLSVRNTFTRKARLVLTLVTLVLGGAIFISVVSVQESMNIELERSFAYYQSDVNVEFSSPYSFAKIHRVIQDVPGVVAVEGWNISRVNVMRPDGENSDQIILHAPPADSKLVTPVLASGRWLLPTDTNAIVVDSHFAKVRPDVKVGDEISIRIGEKEYPFIVIGVFRLAGTYPSPYTFVNNDYLADRVGGMSKVTSLRIVTETHDPAFQTSVLNALQARFDEEHIQGTMQTGSEAITQSKRQTNILIYLLLFMAVLIATVGGLGLTGTMSMNVLERTREIGVMRSIGAESGAIFQMVVTEGLLVGLISWALCIPLSVPLTQLLDNKLGTMIMTLPLFYKLSTQGIFIWLVIVLILATIASLFPARNAVRLTVRDVLAYE